MFGNYVTTAVRNLAKHKLYSAINIAGLATGLACCILILLFVKDELSYDKWLTGIEDTYRFEFTFRIPGRAPLVTVAAPGPARAALEKDFANEIDQATRFFNANDTIILGDKSFGEKVTYVERNFFDIFDLPMIEGDRDAALADNSSLILSESMARKYFGDEPAIGQVLTVNSFTKQYDLRVVAVMRDLPSNTHLDIDFITYLDESRYVEQAFLLKSWGALNSFTYVKFRPREDVKAVSARIPAFLDRNVDLKIPGLGDAKWSELMATAFRPVTDIHLHASGIGGMKPGGDIVTVYTFSAIAVLILIIASINFMNLATARSMERAREVSMRKVLGANRRQLVAQFLGETIIMTLIALAVALAVVEFALPWYNEFISKELTLDYFSDPGLILALAGLASTVGIAGGMYPAFYLSNFRPAKILKANQSSGGGSPRLRAIMVVAQFAISIALIVSTAVVYGQTYYAKNMDMGFTKDNMIVLRGIFTPQIQEVSEALKREIGQLPGVEAVTRSGWVPTDQAEANTVVELPDAEVTEPLVISYMPVDHDFFDTYGISPVAGRTFAEEFGTDQLIVPHDATEPQLLKASIVINELAVKRLGYVTAAAAINKTIKIGAASRSGVRHRAEATIVGVVPDVHFRSAREEIAPVLFVQRPDFFGAMTVKLSPTAPGSTLDEIDRVWGEMLPDVQINRASLEELVDGQYAAEEERAKMFAAFSILAVLVACLGLFGMASFTAERRTREIGIRKVMGASVTDIVRLLTWQFSKPVLLANIIAWPAAFYFMQNWLEGFEYRIPLNPAFFVASGMLALVIAWVTVGLHAARVARSNPADALRHE